MSSTPSSPTAGSTTTADRLRRFGPAAVLAVLAVLFIVQNTRRVKFDFLWLSFRSPLWIMLLIFMAVGAAVGWAALRARRNRR